MLGQSDEAPKDVVEIFHHESSILRLIGSDLSELKGEWLTAGLCMIAKAFPQIGNGSSLHSRHQHEIYLIIS